MPPRCSLPKTDRRCQARAATTLHRFLELPVEIQTMILECARQNALQPHLPITVFMGAPLVLNTIIDRRRQPHGIINLRAGRQLDIPPFHNIMITCRLARRVALQLWIRTVQNEMGVVLQSPAPGIMAPAAQQMVPPLIAVLLRDLNDLLDAYR